MTDVFVSYKSEERERVAPLVRCLEGQGWSVFWDRKIPPGQTWNSWIRQHLDEAKCVVVVWTEASVGSDWVHEEAGQGKSRGVLIPVKLDAVEPPLGFGLIQAADLTEWQGRPDESEFATLLQFMAELIGSSVPPREGGGKVEALAAAKDASKGRPDDESKIEPKKAPEVEPNTPAVSRALENNTQPRSSNRRLVFGAIGIVALVGVLVTLMPQLRKKQVDLADVETVEAVETVETVETQETAEPAATGPMIAAAPADFSVFRDALKDGGEGPEMIVLPQGTFLMGSPVEEAGRKEDERQHEVSVGTFAIGVNEVTFGQFAEFVRKTDHPTDVDPGCGHLGEKESNWPNENTWREPGFEQQPDHPVVCVSWRDAAAYADWLSQETGFDYRLLTEAEWEYAARASSTGANHWGDDLAQVCDYENIRDLTALGEFPDWGVADCSDGYVQTAPVGQFQANGFGIHDMGGNVGEWTCSAFSAAYDGQESLCSEDEGAERVIRGGAWSAELTDVRSANRDHVPVSDEYVGSDLGFRVARRLGN